MKSTTKDTAKLKLLKTIKIILKPLPASQPTVNIIEDQIITINKLTTKNLSVLIPFNPKNKRETILVP